LAPALSPLVTGAPYKRIVARTITPATPQITTIANRKCMAKHLYQKTTATATAATIPHMRPIAITVCMAKPILD
jgi:hypothetical protein